MKEKQKVRSARASPSRLCNCRLHAAWNSAFNYMHMLGTQASSPRRSASPKRSDASYSARLGSALSMKRAGRRLAPDDMDADISEKRFSRFFVRS